MFNKSIKNILSIVLVAGMMLNNTVPVAAVSADSFTTDVVEVTNEITDSEGEDEGREIENDETENESTEDEKKNEDEIEDDDIPSDSNIDDDSVSQDDIVYDGQDEIKENKSEESDIIDSGDFSGLQWELTSDGTLNISGTGDMPPYDFNSEKPWSSYKSDITSVIIGEGITSVSTYAFYSCKTIETVVIPDSVTNIANSAFYSCEKLSSLSIPISANIEKFAFSGCRKINKIIITAGNGSGVTYTDESYKETPWYYSQYNYPEIIIGDVDSIGAYTFYRNLGVEYITIPDSVKSISDYAFANCGKLKEIVFNGYCTQISSSAFSECKNLSAIIVPNEHLEYYQNTFKDLDCSVVPSHVDEVTDEDTGITWSYSNGELSVSYNGTIPGAFFYPWTDYEKSVKSLVLNEGVTGFDEYLARYLDNLEQVQIPASCVNIDEPIYAFYYNEKLQSINVQSGNAAYCSLDGVLFDSERKFLISYPLNKADKEYTVPESCETLGVLFSNNLEKVTLGNGIKSIKNTVGGINVETIHIPDSLTDIEYYVFSANDLTLSESNTNFTYENKVLYNKNKTKICQIMRTYEKKSYTVPDTVKNINLYAFAVVNNDVRINILSPDISFSGNPFGSFVIGKKLYVPTDDIKTKIEQMFTFANITGITVVVDDSLNDENQDDDTYYDEATGIRWKFDNGTLSVYYKGDLCEIDSMDYPWCDYNDDDYQG